MTRPDDVFNWARHALDPEGFWREDEERRAAEAAEWAARERERVERYWLRAVTQLLSELRVAGLLSTGQLSYTRICELERETGLWTGTNQEYYELLREAQQKDKERL
jgi:hypothetical protein